MRLVDADAESERLKKQYCEECTRKGKYGIFGAACTPCWVKDAIEEFENATAVDAEPVRHGGWIPLAGYSEHGIAYCDYACSECWHEITKRVLYVPPRCENCGAKMDGGAEHATD